MGVMVSIASFASSSLVLCVPAFHHILRKNALEALSNTEEEVEMPRLALMRRVVVKVINHRIHRRIQVIAEVDANRPHRRLVSCAQPNIMGKIIEVTRPNASRHI